MGGAIQSSSLKNVSRTHKCRYCNSAKSIKCMWYVNKGSDMAIFTITWENRKEELKHVKKMKYVLQYEMGRYTNSNEVAWQILDFPIHDQEQEVIHLAVHLENGQWIYFTRETAERVSSEPPVIGLLFPSLDLPEHKIFLCHHNTNPILKI